VIPTARAVGDSFALNIRADDIWGNPTGDRPVGRLMLKGHGPVGGLPEMAALPAHQTFLRIEGLHPTARGQISVEVLDEVGNHIVTSNSMVVSQTLALRPYWGDLHAQSGETIGSGSAHDYMTFARDCAFLDMVGHQGNDFQITQEFWTRLNSLMRTWNVPGRFVTVPGYEWSGNTALGGDRNVFYRDENQPIRRSSHALVADRSDADTDCWDARALFTAFGSNFADTIVWAHCGGRYADIAYAHDHALERSVEIHSSWGTFEWLAEDAFKQCYRVGIVGNSDGHKGRPGSEPPGASLFGALGGLTCYWLTELTRDALFDAMHARHHYATTGCRVHLTARAKLDNAATVWTDDPRVTGARSYEAKDVIMGDIVSPAPASVEFSAEVVGDSPILSVELRRGNEVIETIRPQREQPLGRRYRVEWSGAEYRGRARQTVWDGSLKITGADIVSAEPINFLNPDRPLKRASATELSWSSITTGNFSGVELVLSGTEATVEITTPQGVVTMDLSKVGHDPVVKDFGKLKRELRISRQPDQYAVSPFALNRKIEMVAGDNPIWICTSFADGHQAWSSPIYFVRAP
jgi:hypothetical protein